MIITKVTHKELMESSLIKLVIFGNILAPTLVGNTEILGTLLLLTSYNEEKDRRATAEELSKFVHDMTKEEFNSFIDNMLIQIKNVLAGKDAKSGTYAN